MRVDFGYTSGHTFGMKTAISIPDDLFQQGEKLAQDLDLSRSALYAKALREMLQRAQDDAISAEINEALNVAPNTVDAELLQNNLRRMRREMEENGGQW